MFYNARAFNQPVNAWDVSSVTTMAVRRVRRVLLMVAGLGARLVALTRVRAWRVAAVWSAVHAAAAHVLQRTRLQPAGERVGRVEGDEHGGTSRARRAADGGGSLVRVS